jgi:ubiquinone/menaquinone biosynthesis C-methylase UbiE
MTASVDGWAVGLPLPPEEQMRLVSGERPDLREHFEWVGALLAASLKNAEMLEPGSRLLDIGCGCGRVARHLLASPIAEYVGFDRHAGMIEWAQSHIGARDDRFRFEHVDVRSGYEELDGQTGAVTADEFAFPCDDQAFTGALASSVFTHMDFAGTSRYLSEAARVLVPGGRVGATFFLDESTGELAGSGWNFVIREDELRDAIARAGLEVLRFDPPKPPSRQAWMLLGKPR